MTNPIKIISKKDFEKRFSKPIQEEVWNSIADPWKEYRARAVPIVEEFLKSKSGKVVDLGCGSGRNMVASQNITYFGVDFSENQIKNAEKFAKENNINANLYKSKIDKLDKKVFKDNMFDYGLFIATLHCLETKKERKKALCELFRILKPGAEALITVWNSEDNRFKHVGNHGDIYMSWKENNIEYMRYYYLYSKQEFLKLIESVGFKILEFYKSGENDNKLMTLSSKDRFSRKNWVVRVVK